MSKLARVRNALSLSVCVCAAALATAQSTQPASTSAPSATPQHQPPPKVIFVNANVHTMNPAQPMAEAIGVSGDKIVAVGRRDEVLGKRQQETQIVDLGGRTVLPGLIDAHGHITGLGEYVLGRLDLSSAKSWDEVVKAVAERVKTAKPGEWIVGGRWDQESWPGRAMPVNTELNKVSPDNPVWLRRVDGHAGIANEKALAIAEVFRTTDSPLGGEIVMTSSGDLSGVLIDNAMSLVSEKVTGVTTDPMAPIRAAQRQCLSLGLTGVHDAGCSPGDVELYKQLAQRNELKLRIYAMVNGSAAIPYFSVNKPIIGDRLTVRAAKLIADGAMGSRGAWLLAPYEDRPMTEEGDPYTGLCVMQPEFLRMVSSKGLELGFQVCTHAIGDRANREILSAYSLCLTRRPVRDHRFRVEHAQLLSPQDIPRFAELGVIASMQPTHCTSDMRWIEQRVGKERAKGAYAWRSLLRTGAKIAGGSDFPVESPNPFLGIYAAITRQSVDGQPEGGWRPEERMTREEALRAFTLDAAYASFEETKRGSIELGKWADFVVIDRDIMTCEPREIPQTRVLRTVIGGETVYTAP